MTEITREIELSYTLKEKDFVDLKMYSASQNVQINKQRTINRFAVLLLSIILAGFYTYRGDNLVSSYFLLMGAICFILYPWYLNWLYRWTYGRQLKSSSAFPVHVWLKIDETHVTTLSKGITAATAIDEIAEIIEMDNYFYLRKSLAEFIVIPKSELDNEDEVRAFLAFISLGNSITYSDKKGFKWK